MRFFLAYASPGGPKLRGIRGFSFVLISPFVVSKRFILSPKALKKRLACSGVRITRDLTLAFGDPGITVIKSTINSEVE